jgi:ABC-type amino acid transport system permease subunit
MTQVPEPSPEDKAATTSLGDLISEVSKDFSTLMRQELDLAKAELRQSATRAGKGAGLYGGAGIAGHFAVLFLSIALWWGLGYLVGNAWSAVIVAVIWGIIAAIMYLVGRREMGAVKGMPQTVETVKKIPDTLK